MSLIQKFLVLWEKANAPTEPNQSAKLEEIQAAGKTISFWEDEEARLTTQTVAALQNKSFKEAKKLMQQARVLRRRIDMEFKAIGGMHPLLAEAQKDLDQTRCNMIQRIDQIIAEDPWKH